MQKLAISFFIYLFMLTTVGGTQAVAQPFTQSLEAEKVNALSQQAIQNVVSISDESTKIFGVVVKNSTAFTSEQFLDKYFSVIGQKTSEENLLKIYQAIIHVYRENGYFSPEISIKKDPRYPSILQVIVNEPVLLSYDVKGGDSETQAKAKSILNALLGSEISSKQSLEYLEATLAGRLNSGIRISDPVYDEKNHGFHIEINVVGSVQTQITVSNEGNDRLGREVFSAQVQLTKKIPGFKSVYFNTYNTLRTDGYRSVGAGFTSEITKRNELLLSANVSRGRYENLFDSSIPDIVYDRQFLRLGWQYLPVNNNRLSNAIFLNVIANNLEREQYVFDFEENLRAVQLGYWQQNVWNSRSLFWQLQAEQGLDSLGAEVVGPLANTTTEIDYTLVNGRLAFYQSFPKSFGLRTDIQGQYSSDNVPFSQRMTIANNFLARAFESGEINGDSGIGLKLELSKGGDLALLSSRIVPYGYYSLGRVRDNLDEVSTTAASVGLGLRWFNRFMSTYVELGKPLEEDSRYRTDQPRIRASLRFFF